MPCNNFCNKRGHTEYMRILKWYIHLIKNWKLLKRARTSLHNVWELPCSSRCFYSGQGACEHKAFRILEGCGQDYVDNK